MKVRLKKEFYTEFSRGPTTVFSKEVNFPGTMFPAAGMYIEDGNVIDKIVKVTVYTVEGMIEAHLTPDKEIAESRIYGWTEETKVAYMKEKRKYYKKEGWLVKSASTDFATRKHPIEETLGDDFALNLK